MARGVKGTRPQSRDPFLKSQQGKRDRFAKARQKLAENRQNRRLATPALAVATIPVPPPCAVALSPIDLYRLEKEKRAPIIAQKEAEARAAVREAIRRADERQAVHNRGGRPRKAKS